MPPTPQMQPLSKRYRTIIFVLSVLVFLLAVPIFMFYAIGYRIDLDGDIQNFRTVGGMYVSTEVGEAIIYVDDEIVEDMRLFQQAAYIQNLDEGMHRIHTQGEGMQTWVKELPVYAHLVTQASSFNMPASSTVRFVAPYVMNNGVPIYDAEVENERPFVNTVSEVLPQFATTSLNAVAEENPEFIYLETLFASTTEDRALLAEKVAYEENEFSFQPQPIFPETIASTTRVDGDYRLFMEDREVYMAWAGRLENIPPYFCVFTDTYEETVNQYGEHIAEQLFIEGDMAVSYQVATTTIEQNNQLCRTRIKVDRKWQNVVWFEFMPNEPDLVLLQLEDGIYVVEADDRSWQNVQPLYLGNDLTMVVDGGQIFVRDGDIYFELLTKVVVVE